VRSSKRIADLEVSGLVIFFVRYVYPLVGAVALVQGRRNNRRERHAAERLGTSVAEVVVEAKEGAKTLRVLTVWLVVLTIINVGLVAYSVFK
jgi:hypothetical protein